MNDKLPIYKYNLNVEDSGVFAISLVEHPAIESDFVLLSKQERVNFSLNEEQMIVTGPALIPDKLIYRVFENGEGYNVFMDAETIKKTAVKFFKNNNQNNTTLNHEVDVSDTTYFESWIIEDPNNDKSNALGFKDLQKGTWMVSLKVHSNELWNKIKSDGFNGFSIEGYYGKELVKHEKKQKTNIMGNLISKVKEFLSSLEGEVKFTDAKLEDGTIIRIDDATMEVVVIAEDGSMSPLADGEYTLGDGSKLIVKDGKKVEEVPSEEKPEEEVKAESMELTLEDGTKVSVDMDTTDIIVVETGEALADGHYVLDSGEEFDVMDGKIVVPEVEEEKLSKVKLGLVKRDKTPELLSKIKELELKIVELESKPAVEKTATNEKKMVEMSLAERVVYNIKKEKGLL